MSVLDWFRISSLKANPEKFQFTVLGTGKISSYKKASYKRNDLNPIQDGPFRGCSRMEG